MNKLQDIKEKMGELVPELFEPCMSCRDGSQDDGYGNPVKHDTCGGWGFVTKRPITLEDILMAIEKVPLTKHLLVLPSGNIYIFESGVLGEPQAKWQLGKPLTEQSEETIDFIWGLLK